MSDNGSVRSGGSRRYRKVSAGCEVDESLFASRHKDSVSRLRSEREKAGSRSGKQQGREFDSKKEIVISRRQLDMIKSRAKIVSKAEVEEKRREEDEIRKVKMAKANARKQRMLQLEKERKKTRDLTAEEKEDEQKLGETLARAADMRLENLDQVKTMRRKMMYAQCAKIREAQIAEKEKRKLESKLYVERQDTLMELSRLEELKKEEEKKRLQERRRKRDAEAIRHQIEERKKLAMLQEELLAQEKAQMRALIEAEETKEKEKKLRHAADCKQLLEDVLQANEEAIQQKEHRKLEEKEEDERIRQWQESKRIREEQIELEKEMIKKQKDQEFFEVASQMKRSADKTFEEDQLRASRHTREQNKKQREEERREREKAKRQREESQRARLAQLQAKEEQLKMLAIADKEEWTKINRENKEIEEKIEELERRKRESNRNHQVELCDQIKAREEEQRVERARKEMEGIQLREENKRFLKQIQKKKEQILQEMEHTQIPDKFKAEVARMKIKL